MKKIPEHGSCFVCGTQNPNSLGVIWYVDQDNSILGEIVFSLAQQGPPGFAHGGASAAVLDEAMGAAVWKAGHSVAAVNLEINYKKPVPLGEKVIIRARVAETHPRKIYSVSELILSDGNIAVTGRGIYVHAPHLFKDINWGEDVET